MASVMKSLESDNGTLKRMVKKIQQKHRKEKEEKTIEQLLNEPVGGTRKKEARITKLLRRGSKGDTLKAKAPEVDANDIQKS